MKFTAAVIFAATAPGVLARWDCLSDCDVDFDQLEHWRNWKNRADRGPAPFCGNDDFIQTLTECISTSPCRGSDKSDIYRIIAEACANAGRYLTQSPYATVSIDPDAAFPTAGLSSLAAGLASKISSHIADATVTPGPDAPWDGWGHLGRWGGGWGPFGGGWGPLPTDGPWTTGAWTAWWNGTACPHPTWSGWTAGEWRTRADWTSWGGCVATTTTTRVMTVTDAAGGTATSTSYGVKVQEANTEGASWGTPTPTSTSTGGPAAGRERAMGALVAVALGAVMLL